MPQTLYCIGIVYNAPFIIQTLVYEQTFIHFNIFLHFNEIRERNREKSAFGSLTRSYQTDDGRMDRRIDTQTNRQTDSKIKRGGHTHRQTGLTLIII